MAQSIHRCVLSILIFWLASCVQHKDICMFWNDSAKYLQSKNGKQFVCVNKMKKCKWNIDFLIINDFFNTHTHTHMGKIIPSGLGKFDAEKYVELSILDIIMIVQHIGLLFVSTLLNGSNSEFQFRIPAMDRRHWSASFYLNLKLKGFMWSIRPPSNVGIRK